MQLTLDRLTKQFGSKIALDRIDATFEPGVYGLLGANGKMIKLAEYSCSIINKYFLHI